MAAWGRRPWRDHETVSRAAPRAWRAAAPAAPGEDAAPLDVALAVARPDPSARGAPAGTGWPIWLGHVAPLLDQHRAGRWRFEPHHRRDPRRLRVRRRQHLPDAARGRPRAPDGPVALDRRAPGLHASA